MAKLNTELCTVCLEEFCAGCNDFGDCEECSGYVCSECIEQSFLDCEFCERNICKNCLDRHRVDCAKEEKDDDEVKKDGLAKDKD